MGLKVIQNGVGFIGQKAIQLMLRKGYDVVAAIDHKQHIDEDIGELVGLGKKLGINVTNDVERVLKEVKPDIVSDATVTKLDQLYPQLKPFVEAGINVASISEELVFPWVSNPELAKEIDETAKTHNVSVIGSGVNPGLMMDLVPLIFSSACFSVNRIKVRRVIDYSVYSQTRGNLRFGVNPEEFRRGVLEKKIPLHSGLRECIAMVADGMGWKLDNISEMWWAIISKNLRKTPMYTVEPGTTAGWQQTAVGLIREEVKIMLEQVCYMNPSLEEDGVEAGNSIWIDGEPDLFIQTKGDTEKGELCTAARLVNILPVVVDAKPGLISVKDLPVTPSLGV